MSGICGFIALDGRPATEAQLKAISRAQAHRGPDGQASWRQGPVGLGHQMLFASPESPTEVQPWVDEALGLAITADARLDEREELASSLGLSERLRDGIADSQLLLTAYARWGTGCAQRLRGDFAFAIWDRRQRRLFCARDLFGVKPLNYHAGPTLFAFASDMLGVLAHEAVPRELNEGRIADFLVEGLEGIDHHSTFYRGVLRLPPAHQIVVSPEGMTIERYASIEAPDELRLRNDGEYVEAFRERLEVAVRASLRCHGEPASMLSGGLDSATIVAAARELGRHEGRAPLAVFSAQSPPGEGCSETHFSNAVVAQGGLTAQRLLPDDLRGLATSVEAVYAQMEAPFDCLMTLQIALYLRARADGHRIMIDGIEGDLLASLGSGYPGYLLREGRFLRAQREIIGQWFNTYRGAYPLWRLEAQAFGPSLLPAVHGAWKRLRVHKRRAALLGATLLHPEFARRIQIEERIDTLRAQSDARPAATLREARCRQLAHPFLAVGLERYDRIAALCGVEPRHPLLERRLVDFCLALPWEQKGRFGWSKLIMRHAGEGRLPRALCWRRGHEHLGGVYTARWMSLGADAIEAELQAPDPALETYIDLTAGRRAWHAHRKGGSFDDQLNACYAFMLSSWLRRQGAQER